VSDSLVTISKFLSLILRHQPEKIGLTLDAEGWALVDELIACASKHGTVLSRERVFEAVDKNSKQRFSLDASRTRIRANQGHSVDVDLRLTPLEPPPKLFHGTATRFVDSILREGLRPGRRHHVHLSAARETAIAVGARHGVPFVFEVDALAMHHDGCVFFRSENGVWLVAHVPAQHLTGEK
jgi:putative RNA 2'-phosphotransferase